MPQASYVQASFQSGEWSQTMQGRVDRPDYRQGMAVCVNGVITETEAWTRRPGTVVSGFTRGGSAGILRKFEFQESSPYNMEFTDGHLRFWSGANLVTTNDDQVVSSISAANPAAATTALNHGWSTGDQVYFKLLGATAPLLQLRLFTITKTGNTTFTLVDAITGATVDGSTLGFVSGSVARVLDLATSYTASAWSSLRVVQTEKQAVLLNGNAPQVLSLTTLPSLATYGVFSLAAAQFKDGPYLDPYPGSLATPSAKVGNITLTFSFQAYDATVSYSKGDYASSGGHNYKSLQNANLNNTQASSPTFWQEVSAGDPISPTGFSAGDIGRHIRMFSEPALWAVGTAYVANNVVAYNNVYWNALASSTGVAPGTDATKWAVIAGVQYATWSWGRITAVSGSGVISGVLAGSVNIGDMTVGAGLAAAFDGTTSKSAASSAQGAAAVGTTGGVPTTFFDYCYIGKNYSGAAAQAIAQVTVYPSTDSGFYSFTPNGATILASSYTLNLRAKATAPANRSDGTLLGTATGVQSFAAVTIPSNDAVTTWNYVWVEVIISITAWSPGFPNQHPTTSPFIAQAVFFSPNVNNGSVITVQIAGPPLLYTSAIRIWRAGAYSDAISWPKCGTYHEGRLWLAGAIANRFDASQPNDIYNFAPTAPDGTVTDACGISYVFNSPDVNAIFWMAPRQEGIVCGTQAGEWLIQASANNSPLTPTSIQAHKYTSLKCANIEPAQCEHTLVFVQKHKRRMMEYFADIYSGKFASPNLTYKAQHITAPGIAEIRYQQDLMPVVWMRMKDNSLSGLTYKRDSLVSKDGPTISGAHRHTLGSARTVESMAVGPAGDAGELEALSLITTDGTYRYVEIMGQLFGEADALSSAQFLDGAIATTSYVDNVTGLKVFGLWPLNGQTVRVFAGGLDRGTFAVASGQVTLPYGDGIEDLFTAAYVATFSGVMPVLAGFSYTSQGQMLRPHTPQESGARQGPAFGKVRRSHRVIAGLVNVVTNTLSFGTIFTKLKPALFKVENGAKYTPLQLFTDTYKETLVDSGNKLDGKLAWQITGPWPATVAIAGAFLDTEDE